ncbi:MAG: peptidase S10 [Planctomycetota bacterium]|nr:peptidase S10 [Planctomycetota bacterium]
MPAGVAKFRSRVLGLLGIAVGLSLASAQQAPTQAPAVAPAPGTSPEASSAPAAQASRPSETVTKVDEVTIGGETIRYRVSAGRLPLADEEGKAKAHVFHIAYEKLDAAGLPVAQTNPGSRPILFSFNGGPGSSSVWLHLGTIGPRRVVMGPEGEPLPPPSALLPNQESWLDLADLVFIDPVTTGFSRAAAGESDKQFHGLDEDVQSVGQFIHLYLNRNNRWASPKFIAGESYGTTRAAHLTNHLQDRYGMYINGVVLVSAILNFGTARFDVGNDTPHWMFLPTYAATAWYHQRLVPELQQMPLETFLDEVERFAQTDYLLALAAGADLPEDAQQRVAAQIARYTGVSEQFVRRADLRLVISNFTKELLRDEGLTVGRLDSRYTGVDRTDIGATGEFDPSYAAILGTYSGAINDYLRRDLGYTSDLPYEILTGRVQPWNYASATNQYVNVAESLRAAMTRNRSLRVLINCGYFDLATPYFAAERTVAQIGLGLDPELREQFTLTYYPSGHMMYVRDADRIKLKADVAAWMADWMADRNNATRRDE